MSRGRQAQAIKLSREDRKSLELLTRRGTAEHRQVVRAQIALMCPCGRDDDGDLAGDRRLRADRVALAHALGPPRCSGLARGGAVRAGPGVSAPRSVWNCCPWRASPPKLQGRSTPTLDELVERAIERGVVTQISRSHLQRILQAGDLRPHRVRQWLHSPDPQFRQKVNAICALYRQAPKGSVVLVGR